MSFMSKLYKEMKAVAGEDVTIEKMGGVFYVFASEVACLRIFYKRSRIHGLGKEARVLYSEAIDSWYYCDESIVDPKSS